MTPGSGPPANPPIFHITHVSNLPSIVASQGLWCDAKRISLGLTSTNIGYSHIKQRRLVRPVPVAAGGALGDYVPFNFCPRSVMLYVIHKGHQNYGGGQDPIIHLVSSVQSAVATGRLWAFTDRHADVAYAKYYSAITDLGHVPWQVMRLKKWPAVAEERQAEFLVHDFFPWTAVEKIITINQAVAAQVQAALAGAGHQPPVQVEPRWYY